MIGKFDLIKQEQARKLANIGDIRQFEQQTIAQNQGGFVRECIFRGALYLIESNTVVHPTLKQIKKAANCPRFCDRSPLTKRNSLCPIILNAAPILFLE